MGDFDPLGEGAEVVAAVAAIGTAHAPSRGFGKLAQSFGGNGLADVVIG